MTDDNDTARRDLQMRFNLPPTLADVLLLLLKHKVVTYRMIEVDENITKDAKVAVHRLRRRLLDTDIDIKSRRDVGYWLEADAKKLVRAALGPDETELSDGHADNGGAGTACGTAAL